MRTSSGLMLMVMHLLAALHTLTRCHLVPEGYSVPEETHAIDVPVVPTEDTSARVSQARHRRERLMHNCETTSSPVRAGLPISFVNNGADGDFYATVVGLDDNHSPIVLQTDGRWYHVRSNSTTIPETLAANISFNLGGPGKEIMLTIPDVLLSGRIYVSDGAITFKTLATANGPTIVTPDWGNPSDPSMYQSWGFVELTVGSAGTFADLSYVDFIGLPLALQMVSSDGRVSQVRGVNSSAADIVCRALQSYAVDDGQPWDQLCQYAKNGTLLRVTSPGKYIATHPDAFATYYTDYVRQVFDHFSNSSSLQIGLQNNLSSSIPCSMLEQGLNCVGANRIFSMPNTSEIFSCNGVFDVSRTDNSVVAAVAPRLCAAFQRSTLLLDGGSLQPNPAVTHYYSSSPTNRYAQLVHSVQADGVGYAFPYDDVHADNTTDTSGTLAFAEVASMKIIVGGD